MNARSARLGLIASLLAFSMDHLLAMDVDGYFKYSETEFVQTFVWGPATGLSGRTRCSRKEVSLLSIASRPN